MATVGRRMREDVHPRRWTKEEYYRLAELGFFEGQRVELLEGQVVVQSPQKAPHSFHVDRAHRLLTSAFPSDYWVRMQLPLDIGQTTEPEPDVSVVHGPPDQFRSAHPTMAVLIVEVAETTLSYDRRRKGSLYARAAIADYWIINLVDGQVEVYRTPLPDAAQHYGHGYSHRTVLLPGTTLSPLALPQVTIAVNDLIP